MHPAAISMADAKNLTYPGNDVLCRCNWGGGQMRSIIPVKYCTSMYWIAHPRIQPKPNQNIWILEIFLTTC